MEGWVCESKPCLKLAGISYKVVREIMKQLPDYAFRARKDMKVTIVRGTTQKDQVGELCPRP
jgi:hypothetical protein